MKKTSEVTHTPGPWRIKMGKFAWGDAPVIMAQAHMMIGTLSTNPGHEVEANARLIAAAPDLLSALKQVMDEMASRFDYLEATPEEEVAFCKAEAAIATATLAPLKEQL